MITPSRSVFIGALFGLLGVSVFGLLTTWFVRPVTLMDLYWLTPLMLACFAGGALKTEHRNIARQKQSDDLTAAERRAKLEAPAPELGAQPDYEQAWRLAFNRFINAGNLYGFKVRDLAAGPHKVVEWQDWDKVRDPLIDLGVLEQRAGTRWAETWTWERWQREGATLPLPHYRLAPPPVELVVNSAQKQQKQQAREGVDEPGPASRRVIEQ